MKVVVFLCALFCSTYSLAMDCARPPDIVYAHYENNTLIGSFQLAPASEAGFGCSGHSAVVPTTYKDNQIRQMVDFFQAPPHNGIFILRLYCRNGSIDRYCLEASRFEVDKSGKSLPQHKTEWLRKEKDAIRTDFLWTYGLLTFFALLTGAGLLRPLWLYKRRKFKSFNECVRASISLQCKCLTVTFFFTWLYGLGFSSSPQRTAATSGFLLLFIALVAEVIYLAVSREKTG